MQTLEGLQIATGVSVKYDHVKFKHFAAINDDVWIPQIAREGWVIITGDRGGERKSGTPDCLRTIRCELCHVQPVLAAAQ